MGEKVLITVDPTRYRNLRLDDRGRVTIPKEIRDELDASEGDRLEVAIVDRRDSDNKED